MATWSASWRLILAIRCGGVRSLRQRLVRVYVGGRSPSESLVGRRNVLFRQGSNASLSAAAESGNRTLSRLELLNH
jgi:hypothetical protein